MARPARGVLLGLLLGAALAGCGGTAAPKPVTDDFAYDRRAPLRVEEQDLGRQGPVDVTRLTYAGAAGARVPALLATPRGQPPAGCLVFQGGVGQPKEAARALWPGAAALGLATFTIDLRDTGERGTKERLQRVLGDARAIRRTLRDDVLDLRRGLDLLERRPECRRRIGYLGTSNGGVLGALLAGTDRRVRAVALTSLGATWKAALVSSDLVLPGTGEDPERLAAAVRVLAPYDPARWVGRIAPRPVMLVNGTDDPFVAPVDAQDLAAAAHRPKEVVTFPGGHDPFAGEEGRRVAARIGRFFVRELVDSPFS